METRSCPLEKDKDAARDMISYIVKDIDMKLLAAPHVYYVKYPRYNEGLTGIAPIETSHIAFHFWKSPDRKILHHKESNCLLQLDIYTCGSLSLNHIHKVLHHLTRFGPTHVNATLLNRNYSMTLERQLKWDVDEKDWMEWIHAIPRMG
jgi:S-adenosylmethionine/arginine decarboxylase-like enzyme